MTCGDQMGRMAGEKPRLDLELIAIVSGLHNTIVFCTLFEVHFSNLSSSSSQLLDNILSKSRLHSISLTQWKIPILSMGDYLETNLFISSLCSFYHARSWLFLTVFPHFPCVFYPSCRSYTQITNIGESWLFLVMASSFCLFSPAFHLFSPGEISARASMPFSVLLQLCYMSLCPVSLWQSLCSILTQRENITSTLNIFSVI